MSHHVNFKASAALKDEVLQNIEDEDKDTKRSGKGSVPKSLSHLPRAISVFRAIQQDSHVTMKLPADGATSGKVILSASRAVEQLLERQKPMKFMFGLTHDPVFRYHNSRFGYKFGRNSFRNMVVLYSASDAVGPAFLEATLIDKYGSFQSVTS